MRSFASQFIAGELHATANVHRLHRSQVTSTPQLQRSPRAHNPPSLPSSPSDDGELLDSTLSKKKKRNAGETDIDAPASEKDSEHWPPIEDDTPVDDDAEWPTTFHAPIVNSDDDDDEDVPELATRKLFGDSDTSDDEQDPAPQPTPEPDVDPDMPGLIEPSPEVPQQLLM